MFVSSYRTYVDTSSVKRIQSDKQENNKNTKESFSSKLFQSSNNSTNQVTNSLPLSYISDYKTLRIKQQITHQEQSQNSETVKFTKVSAQGNAKIAYEENSKLFSFLIKPKISLDLTPKIDKKLPEEALKNRENILKKQMINTYMSNDNYYQITAA